MCSSNKTHPMPEQFDSNDLSRLLQLGVLGQYQSLEVTTITLTQTSTRQNFNLMTLIVAQNRTGNGDRTPQFVGSRINVPGLPDLSFGIAQHELPLNDLIGDLQRATAEKQWSANGRALKFGNLEFRGHWFAPADGAGDKIALNGLLKNNFWNGSHVWEWVDVDKSAFRSLLEEPRLLQTLSESVSLRLPIRIAGGSDKLGGVIVQLPVQVLNADFRGRGMQGGATGRFDWLLGIPPRNLVVSLSREHDGLFAETSVPTPGNAQVELVLPDSPGMQFATVRDAVTGDVLGRHTLLFIRSIGFNMGVSHLEKRVFNIPNSAGAETQEVGITSTQVSHAGNPQSLSHFADTANRIYRAEMSELRKRLELVQYMPDPQKSRAERHDGALADLRQLIRTHGRHAVWLWDPFLDASDVLKTLLFNPHSESQMRAISEANAIELLSPDCGTAPTPPAGTAASNFVTAQRNILDQNAGNAGGLRLEFRARSDSAGWRFHDRFIIFPQTEGATLAWSLGTSVNSLGIQHHILQKVPDGRLIADAFDALWKLLDQPQHLVWRKP